MMRQFHKSTYSPRETNCVEVAEGTTTAVRDTQNRELGHIEFPAAQWAALLQSVRSGEL